MMEWKKAEGQVHFASMQYTNVSISSDLLTLCKIAEPRDSHKSHELPSLLQIRDFYAFCKILIISHIYPNEKFQERKSFDFAS